MMAFSFYYKLIQFNIEKLKAIRHVLIAIESMAEISLFVITSTLAAQVELSLVYGKTICVLLYS